MKTVLALLVFLSGLIMSPALAQDNQAVTAEPRKNVLSTDLSSIPPDYNGVHAHRADLEQMWVIGVIMALTAGSWLCIEVGKRRKQRAN